MDFAVIWIWCCLILHNLIIDIGGSVAHHVDSDWQTEPEDMESEVEAGGELERGSRSIFTVNPRDFRNHLMYKLFK